MMRAFASRTAQRLSNAGRRTVATYAERMHDVVTAPQRVSATHLNVIKLGTFCRTVVWPLFVPFAMLNYIRQVDEDMWALEVLVYRSKFEDPTKFYDKSRGYHQGHWVMRRDLEIIRAGVNQ